MYSIVRVHHFEELNNKIYFLDVQVKSSKEIFDVLYTKRVSFVDGKLNIG